MRIAARTFLSLAAVALLASCGAHDSVAPDMGGPALKCADSKPGVTRLYWGDLHVHTNYSFDAYFFNELNGPREAFAFAKGASTSLPCTDSSTPCKTVKLDVPLDFTAVTDHSELIGGFTSYCGLPGMPMNQADCTTIAQLARQQAAAYALGNAQTGSSLKTLALVIPQLAMTADAWGRSMAAADEADAPCSFTAFSAYEYTGLPNGASLHRNIIFKGDKLPTQPVSSLDVNNEWEMWNALDSVCAHDQHCDYVSIPHNPNLSEGRMFQLPQASPQVTQAQIEQRARADVLVEVMQHKGESECGLGYANPLSADEDVACSFEKTKPVCTGAATDASWCRQECTSVATDAAAALPANCTARLDMVRDTLVDGLRLRAQYQGTNPYKLGLVGGTDTHNGDPGNVREDSFRGHGGVLDATPDVLLGSWVCADGSTTCATNARVFNQKAFRLNPGGLTGIWAEENTRASLFAALKRREVYATSGPRIAVRLYASWGALPTTACDDLAAGTDPPSGASGLVTMGGDLVAPPAGKAPQLIVRAVADPILGTPLERIEIVKGWIDAAGAPHAKVFSIAGAASGPVPAADCTIDKTSQPEQLCGVWSDPEFDPTESALYYARVFENPSCRWSTWMCVKQSIDCSQLDPSTGALPGAMAGYEGCCAITQTGSVYSGTNRFDAIEERAWSSPVWFQP
jgi:Protein of unknown function (DUF3604)